MTTETKEPKLLTAKELADMAGKSTDSGLPYQCAGANALAPVRWHQCAGKVPQLDMLTKIGLAST